MLLLLIDDDQPQLFHRCKDGGAGAHHDIDLTSADPFVFVQPLAEGESAVHDGDPPAECRQKAANGLRGEGNFRHQHDAAPSLCQNTVRQGEINSGFSAAGHAIQKPRSAALRKALPQCFHRGGLFLGKGGGRLRQDGFPTDGGAQHLLLIGFGNALLHQLFHHSAGDARKVADLPNAAAADLLQQLVNLPLLGGQALRLGAGKPHHLQGFIPDAALHDLLPTEKPEGLQPFQRKGVKGKPQRFRQLGGGDCLAAGLQGRKHLLLGGGERLRQGDAPHQ